MRAKEFTFEATIGTEPKRPARAGSRPDRGHKQEPRYKTQGTAEGSSTAIAHIAKRLTDPKDGATAKLRAAGDKRREDNLKSRNIANKNEGEQFCEDCGGSLSEAGKASRELCKSSKPDADLGASNLASCKSQGLRARDGEKSHKLGKGPKSRVTVGGHRIKGRKYGGPLPDYS